jgi:serine/threonine protein kinase
MVKLLGQGSVIVEDPEFNGRRYDPNYRAKWFYFILPLYDLSLMQVKSNDPMEVSIVLQVGIQIVRQLQICHQAGFIHGDVKPANIMVGEKS